MSSPWFRQLLKDQGDCLIGGSYALWCFETYIMRRKPVWHPSDVDIYVSPTNENDVSEKSIREQYSQLLNQCGPNCNLKSIKFNRMYNLYQLMKPGSIPKDLGDSPMTGISYNFDKSIIAVGTFDVPKQLVDIEAFTTPTVDLQVILFDKRSDGCHSSKLPSLFQGISGLADIGIFMAPPTQYWSGANFPAWYFRHETYVNLTNANTLEIWDPRRQKKYEERGYRVVKMFEALR